MTASTADGAVTLRHPTLPTDQTVTVAPEAARHHARAGWVPVDAPAPVTDGEETEPAAPKGRRTLKKEN